MCAHADWSKGGAYIVGSTGIRSERDSVRAEHGVAITVTTCILTGQHNLFFSSFFKIYFILVHTIWPMASFRCQPVTFFFRTFTLNNNRRIMKQCQWVYI